MDFPAALKERRAHRRMSQLELALKAGTTQRHLSFIESGRSAPGREMVIRLAESLSLPLRERNELLLKAGYAPAYPETALDRPALTPVREALTHVLAAHMPYPAIVVDRYGEVVAANAAQRVLTDGCADHVRGNAYRLALHPDGMASRIVNFADWARHVLNNLAAELNRNPTARLAELHAELSQYVPPARVTAGHLGFAVPLQLRTPHGELRLMTTITTFATAVDVTVSELKLEAFLPADEATAAALARAAAGKLPGPRPFPGGLRAVMLSHGSRASPAEAPRWHRRRGWASPVGGEALAGRPGLEVIVAGAGIGGAAAAVALRLAGHRVTVLEQAAQPAPVGAGIQLAPNATRILTQFGVAGTLARDALVPQRIVRRSWRDGTVLAQRPLGAAVEARYRSPFWHVHRADLHRALLSAASSPAGPGPAAVFRFGAEVTGLDASGSTPEVLTSRGERYRGDLVVGADGVHSKLRTLLFGGGDSRGIPKGVAFRSLIPVSELSRGGKAEFRDILGSDPAITEWLSPGIHFIHYYVSRGRYLNAALLRYSAEGDPGAESWLREGDRREYLALLDGWDPRLVDLARLADTVFCTGVYEREPMTGWVRGSACLLGDACHPMMPTQAQGAAQAIEDAWYLGRVLRGVGPGDLPRALAAYQEERLPRTAAVQRLSAIDRGTGLDQRPERASPARPAEQPADFSPYEWLWPYGDDSQQGAAGDASQ